MKTRTMVLIGAGLIGMTIYMRYLERRRLQLELQYCQRPMPTDTMAAGTVEPAAAGMIQNGSLSCLTCW